MDIYWSKAAIRSLKSTRQFLLELWNEIIVIEFEKLLEHKILQIKEHPYTGTTFYSYRKIIIHSSTSLFYEVKNDKIVIHLIWDNRMNPKKLQAILKNH